MTDTALPTDPFILLSYVNTKLRDEFADGGLDAMCREMGLDRNKLEQTLAEAGFEYSPENNRFW